MKYGVKGWSWLIVTCFSLFTGVQAQTGKKDAMVQIAYVSDLHYGIARKTFEGKEDVPSYQVNAVMLKKMNTLPSLVLPKDGGVGAKQQVGAIDYLVVTGDIANRQEYPIQSATASWQQFQHDYLTGLTTYNRQQEKTVVLLTPGNHDASNAVGHYKNLQPATDATSMVNIYNLMMHPAQPKTLADFNYNTDKVNYSRNIAGVHCMFLCLWADSVTRVWMEQDLKSVSPSTPVLLFVHVPPQGEPKHFTNPHIPHTINAKDKFENLMPEYLQDTTLLDGKPQDLIEERAFAAFIKRHPNIKAYFHGHENANEFYTYKGPDNDVSLPVFRVDSPMKGRVSAKEEKKLSFQLISIDPHKKKLTVRECLWNKKASKNSPIVWGESITIDL
ncbi:Calcineurin-like phosphoesterase [Filimonas lacunae]|uniref:Calcineurin-like phosphoesterase n=1 Tax=Filimonas lacunae TaxID=477680 RepID=A0A173MH87_9BACT|nr:metallophosphoesterase [Filimonas lacunae]BAV06982.1 hypothetical protein FLA_3002 [Filimonas lacunae]SIS96894.1 Calcineurin-like phosphoesterase [Filimonas lacunae]